MADYKIIRVCIPYTFLDIPLSFLEFISPPGTCPKNFLPIYILTNKITSKIIKISYNSSQIFKKKDKLDEDERIKLEKESIKITINKRPGISENENFIMENYEIFFHDDYEPDNDDMILIDNLNEALIKELVAFTERFRIDSEKSKIESFLKSTPSKPKPIKKNEI